MCPHSFASIRQANIYEAELDACALTPGGVPTLSRPCCCAIPPLARSFSLVNRLNSDLLLANCGMLKHQRSTTLQRDFPFATCDVLHRCSCEQPMPGGRGCSQVVVGRVCSEIT